jgi:hypothetical protein
MPPSRPGGDQPDIATVTAANEGAHPVRVVTSRMPAVPHPYTVREPSPTKCADCLRLEGIVADIATLVEALRRSRDSWRDLALEGTGREDREETIDRLAARFGRSPAWSPHRNGFCEQRRK